MKLYQVAGGILTGAAALILCGSGGSAKEVRQTNKNLALCVDVHMNDTYKDGFEEFEKAYPDLIRMQNYGTADVYKMMKAQINQSKAEAGL